MDSLISLPVILCITTIAAIVTAVNFHFLCRRKELMREFVSLSNNSDNAGRFTPMRLTLLAAFWEANRADFNSGFTASDFLRNVYSPDLLRLATGRYCKSVEEGERQLDEWFIKAHLNEVTEMLMDGLDDLEPTFMTDRKAVELLKYLIPRLKDPHYVDYAKYIWN